MKRYSYLLVAAAVLSISTQAIYGSDINSQSLSKHSLAIRALYLCGLAEFEVESVSGFDYKSEGGTPLGGMSGIFEQSQYTTVIPETNFLLYAELNAELSLIFDASNRDMNVQKALKRKATAVEIVLHGLADPNECSVVGVLKPTPVRVSPNSDSSGFSHASKIEEIKNEEATMCLEQCINDATNSNDPSTLTAFGENAMELT